MTATDLIALLDRLLALPAKTELLEFKTAGNNFGIEDLGNYFSATFWTKLAYSPQLGLASGGRSA
jgi:hypothetical protein